MEFDNATARSNNRKPPYTSYQTLKTMAQQMNEHGLPSRIDRSVLTNFSGAVGTQLLTALKFLNLTDNDGHPTDALNELVTSYGTEEWSKNLSDIVRKAYEPIFELDLQTASPNQFTDKFRAAYPSTEDVSRKSITFFLNAAQDSEITISPYILKNKKPRLASKKKGAGAGARKRNTGASAKSNSQPPVDDAQPKSPSEIILGFFDPEEMEDAEQEAVWTLLKYFKSKGQ